MKCSARTSSYARHVAGCVACLLASAASADTVQIDAYHRGNYSADGRHRDTIQNTFTGYESLARRSYFAFDLASISGMMVTSATFVLQVVSYQGAIPQHSFTLYDVSSAVTNVVAGWPAASPTGQAIFSDLGSGDPYASGTVPFFPPFSLPPPDRVLPLSAAALEDLSAAAGGLFAIGALCTTAPGPTVAGVSFSDANVLDPGPWRHYLVLETAPLPVEYTRISAMSISNDVIDLQFSALPVGSTVAVQRTVAILEGWDHVESFVPTSTTTNWSEPWNSRVHALYRLTED